MHLAATSPDFVGSDDLVHRPIAPFNEHVRLQMQDQLQRGRLVEDDHFVDAPQSQQQPSTFTLADVRFVRPLESPDRRIAIETDDERIAECPATFEQIDMPDVEQVKTAVGEYEFSASQRIASVQFV